MFKIDFEKAYDNVDWSFLISIMKQTGFPDRWCLWIEAVLKSARSSVLVNGSPTYVFQCEKGLRQGDPLSPFLFLIVTEAFACLINKASDVGVFYCLKVGNNGPLLSHLFYVDDALIVGKWSVENFKNMLRLLRIFLLSTIQYTLKHNGMCLP